MLVPGNKTLVWKGNTNDGEININAWKEKLEERGSSHGKRD